MAHYIPGMRSGNIGEPFPMIIERPAKEVGVFGDMAQGSGAKVLIYNGNIIFLSTHEGSEMTIGVSIEHMLDKIGEYTRETGS